MRRLPDNAVDRIFFALASRRETGSPLGELIRYGAASGIAFAADFGTLVLLTELAGLHYLASAVIGFGAGILAAYLLSVHWVFATRRLASVAAERTIFVLVGIAGLAINQVVIYSLTESGMLPYAVSKLVSAGIVFIFNFSVRKLALFSAPTTRQGAAL